MSLTRDTAQTFFSEWVARNFAPGSDWADAYPTPLCALEALRLDAATAGLTEAALRAAIGDLLPALVQAMLDAPAPHRRATLPAMHVVDGCRAAQALELSLSYLDGLRATVGDDMAVAADLVLYHLARQGYVLRATPAAMTAVPKGEATACPADLAAVAWPPNVTEAKQ